MYMPQNYQGPQKQGMSEERYRGVWRDMKMEM